MRTADVDICVELKRPSLFTLVHIKEELQELFGRPVDIVRLRLDMDSVPHNNIIKDVIYA